MIGEVYNMPPQPPVAENTRQLPAGSITFGVEYRDVDPASLSATYADNAAYLAELHEKSPEGGFSDSGVSIHVCDTEDGHEYVRFDIFDDDPHYHYIHPTAPGAQIVNNVVAYDTVALGDMLTWTLERLRTRLPAMLEEAGAAELARRLDTDRVAAALDEVQALAEHAQAAFRAADSR
jgi:hypothetical protein